MESQELKKIIEMKKTKICFAADVTNMNILINLISLLGQYFCVLKIHSEIIEDFYLNFTRNCNILRKLSKKYNFLIWEDRKLADIDSVMLRQIDHIKKWADMVSIHPISGFKSFEDIRDIKLILIAEMSTKDNLFNEKYTSNVIKIANEQKNVIGIVSQHKHETNSDIMYFVPGISNFLTTDDKGQMYNTPESKDFADVFVIGRSIYLAESPLDEILSYKDKIL